MSTIGPQASFKPTNGQIALAGSYRVEVVISCEVSSSHRDDAVAPVLSPSGGRRAEVMFWMGVVDRILQIVLFTLILLTGTPVIAAEVGILVNVLLLLVVWTYRIRCRNM